MPRESSELSTFGINEELRNSLQNSYFSKGKERGRRPGMQDHW